MKFAFLQDLTQKENAEKLRISSITVSRWAKKRTSTFAGNHAPAKEQSLETHQKNYELFL
ncbi:MAG: hypothetical protein WBA01_18270 [Phormidesmis sp.]